jgi:hypothetical protein
LRDMVGRGWNNGLKGRNILRIDERIMVGK